jgi:hypothetical protein
VKRLGRHLAHHSVAYVALFFALSGTAAVAATTIPRNSVGSLQVKDHSLLAKDFKKGQIPRGARGPAGPAGAAGPAGPTGPAGPAGPAGSGGSAANYTIHKVTVAGGAAAFTQATALCGSGTKLVGGGFGGKEDKDSPVVVSRPGTATSEGATGSTVPDNGASPNAWTVQQWLATAGNVTVYALCAS